MREIAAAGTQAVAICFLHSFFNLTLPRAVDALLQRFPPDTLQPGDLLATNDPWICAGHLYDVALVTPVFRADHLVGLVGSIAHCSDVGGALDPLEVREVYEEGLQIPPMKLHRAGVPNQEVYELIAANVRKGDMVIGDLRPRYRPTTSAPTAYIASWTSTDSTTFQTLRR